MIELFALLLAASTIAVLVYISEKGVSGTI